MKTGKEKQLEIDLLVEKIQRISKKKVVFKENTSTTNLPESIESFLQDIAKTTKLISNSDITRFNPSPENLSEIRKLKKKIISLHADSNLNNIPEVKEVVAIVKKSKKGVNRALKQNLKESIELTKLSFNELINREIKGNFQDDRSLFNDIISFCQDEQNNNVEKAQLIDKFDSAMGETPDTLPLSVKVKKFLKDATEGEKFEITEEFEVEDEQKLLNDLNDLKTSLKNNTISSNNYQSAYYRISQKLKKLNSGKEPLTELETKTYSDLMDKTSNYPWMSKGKQEKNQSVNKISRERFVKEFYKEFPQNSSATNILTNKGEYKFLGMKFNSNFTLYNLLFDSGNAKLWISPEQNGYHLDDKSVTIDSESIKLITQMLKYNLIKKQNS